MWAFQGITHISFKPWDDDERCEKSKYKKKNIFYNWATTIGWMNGSFRNGIRVSQIISFRPADRAIGGPFSEKMIYIINFFYVVPWRQKKFNTLVGELITETCKSFRQLHSIIRHHKVEKMLEDYLRARQNNYNNKNFMCLRPQVSSYSSNKTVIRRHNFAHAGLFRKSIHEVMSKARWR